jgi:hypothetical protein
MTLDGWGRCLKVTLQTHAPENFHLCRWGDERTVKRAQTVSDDPHWRELKLSFNDQAIENDLQVVPTACISSSCFTIYNLILNVKMYSVKYWLFPFITVENPL